LRRPAVRTLNGCSAARDDPIARPSIDETHDTFAIERDGTEGRQTFRIQSLLRCLQWAVTNAAKKV
jgi:hypothetical protein